MAKTKRGVKATVKKATSRTTRSGAAANEAPAPTAKGKRQSTSAPALDRCSKRSRVATEAEVADAADVVLEEHVVPRKMRVIKKGEAAPKKPAEPPASSSSSALVTVPSVVLVAGGAPERVLVSDLTFCMFLRELFADDMTLKFMFLRWRSSMEGNMPFLQMAEKMFRLLFDIRVGFMVMNGMIVTHEEDWFYAPFATLTPHLRELLLAMIEHGCTDDRAYTCVSERFVKKTSFVNFRLLPSDRDLVVYDAREVFVRFVDFELSIAKTQLATAIMLDSLAHMAISMMETNRKMHEDRRVFLEWVCKHVGVAYEMVWRAPEMVVGAKSAMHTAFLAFRDSDAGKGRVIRARMPERLAKVV